MTRGTPARRAAVLGSSSPEETEAIARRLAALLASGDVVSLSGELGAGKTRFVRGALAGFGVAGGGQSPSYVLEREYAGRVAVRHLDLYRIEGEEKIRELGIPERFADGGVFLIEWGERAGGLLPEGRFEVTIEDLGGTERRIRIDGPAERVAAFEAAAA